MKKQSTNENGWRGSPDLWISAAREILLKSGIESVKISTLSKRLNLSRTSFYWFFSDREELLAALIKAWRDQNTGGIIKQSQAYADSLAEATLNVFDCWLDEALFDSKFEFAIRSWALQSAEIQQEVQAADTQRLAALTSMFERYGDEKTAADVHARALYLVQIGYISMQSEEDITVRLERVPEYIKTFTGTYPKTNEIERFHHRHGAIP